MTYADVRVRRILCCTVYVNMIHVRFNDKRAREKLKLGLFDEFISEVNMMCIEKEDDFLFK